MTLLFFIPAILLLLQSVVALIEGRRYYEFVRRDLAAPPSRFAPPATIIAPCKGRDPNLEANLQALFEQDYADYDIVLALATDDDEVRPVIEAVAARNPQRPSRIVFAGRSQERSEKVNNLLAAIDHLRPESEVLAFVDSDARVGRHWLASLVAPLEDAKVGAATGYRWHLPETGGFWAALLSAWNGAVATQLGDHGRNFAWGGSTAIRREVFEAAGVRGAWQNALSDDYALTEAVRRAGYSIRFVPRCLVEWREDFSASAFWEFTTRQIIITRVYNPSRWRVAFIAHALFVLVFFGGLSALLFGGLNAAAGWLLAAIYALGSWKGLLRWRAARIALSPARRDIDRLWWVYIFLWPLVSLVYLYNFAKSATTRRIHWRGVVYEMRSPTETRRC